MANRPDRPAAASAQSLSGLMPFLQPYRLQIALAMLFLVLAAVSTLLLPAALKSLVDQGIVSADPGQRVMALREHFLALFGVGVALGVFSACRFYMVTWLVSASRPTCATPSTPMWCARAPPSSRPPPPARCSQG